MSVKVEKDQLSFVSHQFSKPKSLTFLTKCNFPNHLFYKNQIFRKELRIKGYGCTVYYHLYVRLIKPVFMLVNISLEPFNSNG